MKQLYIKNILQINQIITLKESQHHYLIRVRRMQMGDALEILDSNNTSYLGIIQNIKEHSLDVFIEKIIPKELLYQNTLHLYFSLLKGNNNELVIRQAVEAGITSITPLESEHCVFKFNDAKDRLQKKERWEKIITEAMQQCQAPSRPTLHSSQKSLNLNIQGLGLFAHQSPLDAIALQTIKQASSLSLLVGPEGGFSQRELEYFTSKQLIPILFPSNILRAETASLYFISYIQGLKTL